MKAEIYGERRNIANVPKHATRDNSAKSEGWDEISTERLKSGLTITLCVLVDVWLLTLRAGLYAGLRYLISVGLAEPDWVFWVIRLCCDIEIMGVVFASTAIAMLQTVEMLLREFNRGGMMVRKHWAKTKSLVVINSYRVGPKKNRPTNSSAAISPLRTQSGTPGPS